MYAPWSLRRLRRGLMWLGLCITMYIMYIMQWRQRATLGPLPGGAAKGI